MARRYDTLEDQIEFLKDKVSMLDDKIKMMNEMMSMMRLTMERGLQPIHVQREPVHIGVVHMEPIVEESQIETINPIQTKATHNPRTRSIS